MNGRILCFALLCLGFASNTAAQKLPVFLDTTVIENDPVGTQFIFELKEALRGSASFRLEENASAWPYVSVSIITMQAGGLSKLFTAISLAFAFEDIDMPMYGAFITSGLNICGRDRVQGCARGTLASLDAAMERLRQRAPELRKRLP